MDYKIALLLLVTLVLTLYQSRKPPSSDLEKAIYTMYRQCARYALASEQDEAEIVKVLHANYAAGYLWAIKDITTGEDFKRVTGEDLLTFENEIVKVQDKAALALLNKCQGLIPKIDKTILQGVYAKGL